ncbi:MAG: GlsB/YeaQ/YmgE family stress response membrane protein [Acidobacteria bacterium]|nr:GlsB/YeaQ/YmgE family stress response membrane protein [Acidobacteriota bacterium]
MELLWTALIGLLAGALAKLVMPGNDPGGCIVTMLIGIGGAFVATFLGQLAGLYQPGQAAGFVGAVVGAVILLAVYRMFVGRKKT